MIPLTDYINGLEGINVIIDNKTYKVSWSLINDYDAFLEMNNLEPSDDTFTLWDNVIKEAVATKPELFGHMSPANAHAGSVFERLDDSLSWKQLASELEKHFGYELVGHVNSKSKYSTIFRMDIGDSEDRLYTEDLYNLLSYYNYYVESIDDRDKEHIIITIAPWKPESANKLVYEECSGILYHAVFKDELKKIKKYGLSPRAVREEAGWQRPYRRFFIVNKDEKKAIDEVKSIARLKVISLNARMRNTGKQYRVSNDDIVILRIDLSKVFDINEPEKQDKRFPHSSNDKRYKFYHDPSAEGYNAVYTVDTIHPKSIEEI